MVHLRAALSCGYFAGCALCQRKLRDVKWLSAALTAVTAAVGRRHRQPCVLVRGCTCSLHASMKSPRARCACSCRTPASFDPGLPGRSPLAAAVALLVLKLNLLVGAGRSRPCRDGLGALRLRGLAFEGGGPEGLPPRRKPSWIRPASRRRGRRSARARAGRSRRG